MDTYIESLAVASQAAKAAGIQQAASLYNTAQVALRSGHGLSGRGLIALDILRHNARKEG